MKKRGHFIISGMVQGVCYRMYTVDEARRLGITGWVRNLRDGTVEVVAEGEEEVLNKVLVWCRKGSSFARVTDVRAEYLSATGEFESFEIVY
ncbi:acylphosphatase [Verrucomicrobiota bacterium]